MQLAKEAIAALPLNRNRYDYYLRRILTPFFSNVNSIFRHAAKSRTSLRKRQKPSPSPARWGRLFAFLND